MRVLVHPNAKRPGVTAVTPEALEVNLRSPPMKNKANTELIELLADVLDVSKSEIKIIAGMQSREKFLSINRQKSFLEQKLPPSP
jgi:uncharacterized protein (TIGR00251 family)